MSRFGKGNFGSGVEINAQVVNGKCPFCTTNGVFVSIHKTIFRCITCGGDIEQKINGKISYIPLGGDIVMKDTKDLTDG
jgi:ribosomal protein S27AE